MSLGDGAGTPARAERGRELSYHAAMAELCQRLVMDKYAPAAVLINRKYECLYSLGPTDRYLRMAPGRPNHDLLAMVRGTMRSTFRSAIQHVSRENARIVVAGGLTDRNGGSVSFSIEIQLVPRGAEELLLVCFINEPKPEHTTDRTSTPKDATNSGLRRAVNDVEMISEEHKGVNGDALSLNEEFQSTNEELLTSKEELQSLNEELLTLNSQLRERLERQHATSSDLKNILDSTDVATIFLDTDLNIRFFTPATRSLFSVILSDVGRPLADFSSLAADGALLTDARTVLGTGAPLEREIEAHNSTWFVRRILPYRTLENGVEGVVITFTDITERKQIARTLEKARQQAELAAAAKSRFLAAANHDLRQPLQTLALLQGMMATVVEDEKIRRLVARTDEALAAMSGILNALFNINQIEAGIVRATLVRFPIGDVLGRLRDEFTCHTLSRGLSLRVVSCGLSIRSDPRLLEQMIRNLLTNALKYTRRGKVLLGCRRRGGTLNIEIWKTGIGVPAKELETIFEEDRPPDNGATERSRSLGPGLHLVQRLGDVVGHRVSVRSHPGKGPVFSIEVKFPPDGTAMASEYQRPDLGQQGIVDGIRRSGTILVIEDDPDVCELLELVLKDEGHRTATASDGIAALELVARGTIRPDLILADHNLPNGMDGVQVTAKLRDALHRQVPVIILRGDISTDILLDIAQHDCVQLHKPVRVKELAEVIQRLLLLSQEAVYSSGLRATEAVSRPGAPIVFVVDDDDRVRDTVRSVLEEDGQIVEDYATCEAFLETWRPGRAGCLLVDAYLPGMNGLELLERIKDTGQQLPSIMVTGYGDVSIAVKAMKAGAVDFIEKPINRGVLLASIARATEQSRDANRMTAWREDAAKRIAGLTPRQRQIMEMILAGHPNKNIAAEIGISQRAVEAHRHSIMRRTGSQSLPALARLALDAASYRTE